MTGYQNLQPPSSFDWEGTRIRDWGLKDPEIQIRLWLGYGRGPKAAVEWITKELGSPSRSIQHEGVSWTVWEDPLYTLYVHSAESLALDVPKGVVPEKTAEAVLWDLRLLERTLSREEQAHWVKVGSTKAEPHIVELPALSQADLRRFVLDYCDGLIFCDHQVESVDNIGMVFLPIALGGFSPEKDSPACQALSELPQPPSKPKPKMGPEPVEPVKVPYPKAPFKPEKVLPDQEKIRKLALLDSEVDIPVDGIDDLFVAGPSTAVADYRKSIELKNEALQEKFEKEVQNWKAAADLLEQEYATALINYIGDKASWEKEAADLQERIAEWEREEAIANAVHQGFQTTRLQNYGVIYEQLSKAGPRSINGNPCFFSCRILSASDWDRVRPAIVRELKHREELEIL